jgi:hypothetical protein
MYQRQICLTNIFILLSIFLKNKSWLMKSPPSLRVCVFLYVSPPINFRIPEPTFMKLGMYIMVPNPISTVSLKNNPHQ